MVRHILIKIIVVSLMMVNYSFAKVDQIREDYEAGRISMAEKITFMGYHLFAPQRLPEKYQEDAKTPIKCGTPIVADLKKHWDLLDMEERRFFKQMLSRPGMNNSWISPDGLFKLHYNKTGFDAVPLNDSNNNSIPDYIEEAARIFDHCYHVEIDTMGYQTPPLDNNVDGPEIDVYFLNIRAYGYTNFEDEISNTPYDDWTSYIIIDNNFSEVEYYTKGLDAVRVTAAHELFHVIQLGYNYRDMDLFFFEMASTWMEDRVYDEINDYYQYLTKYFGKTDIPLSYQDGAHEYGAAIFLKFIQEYYSENYIRYTWENIRESHSMNALNRALSENGSSLAAAFNTFAIWNYFTDFRSRFYKDGQNYPKITIKKSDAFFKDTTIVDSSYFLTSNYYKLTPKSSGYYNLQPKHDSKEIEKFWSGVIIDKPEGYFISDLQPNAFENLGFVNSNTDIILISTNVEIPDKLNNNLSTYDQSRYRYKISQGTLRQLAKVFPNPFKYGEHDHLSLKVDIPTTSLITCHILTESGRNVQQIDLGRYSQGENLIHIPWEGTDTVDDPVASGVYLCILSGKGVNLATKFVVVKP